jgi:alkyl hydroperoxide reductase subunit AhpC
MNDLPVGRSVDETLRLVQAFQYTDMHGEVCPANWKPGGQTVKNIFLILMKHWIKITILLLK